MKKKKLSFLLIVILKITTFLFTGFLSAQQYKQNWVTVGNTMVDFTLTSFQGEDVTLSQFKGNNVMLIFPRGYMSEGAWCPFCLYRYAQLLNLEKEKGIREKYDLKIVYVMPYGKELIQDWLNKVQEALVMVTDMKKPSQAEEESGKTDGLREKIREIAPQDLTMEKEDTKTPFPILIDEEHAVSERLGLFRTEWSGSKVDQNIPSVFIIDKEGKLQFKYVSQHTFDRPDFNYLFKVLSSIDNY